jgi:hypothetical protein
MAALGSAGVNLHGGANGYYSPIVGSIPSGYAVRPEYYGLMLAQQFSGRTLRRTTLEAQGANLTAYAAREEKGEALAALFNKDAREVEVVLSAGPKGSKRATIERLTAPAIDSKDGVTFQGAAVDSGGAFHPRAGEAVRAQGDKLSVRLPAYSAALVRFD